MIKSDIFETPRANFVVYWLPSSTRALKWKPSKQKIAHCDSHALLVNMKELSCHIYSTQKHDLELLDEDVPFQDHDWTNFSGARRDLCTSARRSCFPLDLTLLGSMTSKIYKE